MMIRKMARRCCCCFVVVVCCYYYSEGVGRAHAVHHQDNNVLSTRMQYARLPILIWHVTPIMALNR